MATTGVGFRWLDILEKEFDKACVELDTSLSDLETEDPEVVFSARQKIATLSSCFAQLTHKALTIFQNSAKLEAELVDMRAELVQARAAAVGRRKDSGEGFSELTEASRARAEAAQLARENAALRDTVLALHSELFGARLATKYLDKELAGRIQQLQLLGRDMRSEVRDSLWAQVEAEILLQRHKTLVRVCRGLSPRPPRPPPASRPRTVRVRRSPHLGLGISVTGGREHGVPILISELEAGGPAALTGELYVGDAILAINDVDLTQACHKEAVQALQSVKGDCALCVQFIATDDDDRLSEHNYRFPLYPEDGEAFGEEPDGSGATPTAPRTPDYNNRPESVVGSGSECGSARYRPSAPYPDYNSINNNLSILDMDDDSIKIEARLEMVRLEAENSGERRRGPYQAVAGKSPGISPVASPLGSPRATRASRASRTASSASPASPLSTPVHARRLSLKKRRKPQDWRTKGTYCAVSGDAHSSDEPHTISESAAQPPAHPSLPQQPPALPAQMPARPVTSPQPLPSTAPIEAPLVIINNTAAVPQNTSVQSLVSESVLKPSPPSPPSPQSHPAPPLPSALDVPPKQEDPVAPLVDVDIVKSAKTNGETKPRREPKGFRIGSARRVTETAPMVNGVVERGKMAPRLLPGRGDPDFGTPV
ncbi:uncharacterized protein [Battus philenor]|uniref:uncharacterized protein isoform X2 n=1 Tax=Battus philenor TaxID=42288 RepID=UPI0035CFF22B